MVVEPTDEVVVADNPDLPPLLGTAIFVDT
jgi:hypothetical protein